MGSLLANILLIVKLFLKLVLSFRLFYDNEPMSIYFGWIIPVIMQKVPAHTHTHTHTKTKIKQQQLEKQEQNAQETKTLTALVEVEGFKRFTRLDTTYT